MVCGKNFVSFGRLKSHEKTHSKTRPFKCIDCGKTFTVRYSLICHTRVHTRERPYHCTVCG
ncbi:zinc finger-like protein, partial [Dinothrombium tinctorium]